MAGLQLCGTGLTCAPSISCSRFHKEDQGQPEASKVMCADFPLKIPVQTNGAHPGLLCLGKRIHVSIHTCCAGEVNAGHVPSICSGSG